MEDCIFCKIVAGEIPCYKVAENNNYLAFLDVNPLTKGHVLVVPKKHARWVHDVENFGEYWVFAKEVEKKLEAALQPTWTQYFTQGVVPHAHIHIIPRYTPVESSEAYPKKPIEKLSTEEMLRLAERIAQS
ncbi:MAG: HIT domain protein [Microgenomates bacterium OLB23]|nr:MAG: HIT domain protein [Microgenomates bacterium OLB23]